MLKRNITVLLLLSSLFMAGCDKAATNTPENTNIQNENVVVESTYVTENVSITNFNDALKKLKDGNDRFYNNKSQLINVTSERRQQLVEGQSPYAIIVSCSDSRVTPSTIFNAGLGEIFDIRIAGNIVDQDALGSIEYGVDHLKTPLIVVMGHEKCGAVTAAYDKLKNGTEVSGHLATLVDTIVANIRESDSLDEAIHDNTDEVAEQIENDPIIKKYVDEGKVKIVEAHYSLDGKVTFED